VVIFTARNTNIYNWICELHRAIFPSFYNISNQSLHCYSFQDALSSCGAGFRSSCLDQNLVYSWNHPFKTSAITLEGMKMWPVKMTGEVKKWPVMRHLCPVIVRRPAVILSPACSFIKVSYSGLWTKWCDQRCMVCFGQDFMMFKLTFDLIMSWSWYTLQKKTTNYTLNRSKCSAKSCLKFW
jgi:hypothetical protein